LNINIEELKKGDSNAFELLVKEYQNKVFSVCVGVLSNREDALDVTQEVFIKIFNGISKFNEESSLSTWIFRITKNACYDLLRKRRYDFESEIPENIVDDKRPLPEDIITRLERIDVVRQLIKKIPVNYRTPLILREYENLAYGEIAKILEISEGTVKSRIFRAKEYLIKLVSENKELI